MMLLTQDHRKRLIANGQNRGDHVPIVKLFNPVGTATWLLSELDSDGDTLFGLADLGFGCAELGSVSLSEIASLTLPLSLSIERDLHFEACFPLTVYADAARLVGRITEDEARLEAAALAQAQERHA